MIPRNPVGYENKPSPVELPVPPFTVAAEANLRCLVDLGVRVGFVATLVPSPAPENTHPGVQRLLEISAEAIFDRGLQRVRGDVRNGRRAGEKIIDGLTVTSHVRVVHKTQQPHGAFPVMDHGSVKFHFHVFRPRAAHIRVDRLTYLK
jgi:hypothetical protein